MGLVRKISLCIGLCIAGLIALGSASAGATALCEIETAEGICSRSFAKSTAYAGKASSSVFETGAGSVTCTSNLEGKLSEAATAEKIALKTSVTSLVFSSCLLSKTSCTVESVGVPYSAPLSWASGDDGTLTLKKTETGPIKLSVNCGLLLSCTLEGEPSLTLDGKSAATLSATKVKLTGSGTMCGGKEIFWTVSYALSAPGAGTAYVAKMNMPDRLCASYVNICNNALTYLKATTLEAALEGEAKFTVTRLIGGTQTDFITKCPTSALKGQTTTDDGVSAEISAWTFACNAPCSVTVLEGPFESTITATRGAGTGEMTAYFNPTFAVDCGTYKCTYKTSTGGITMKVVGGAPAKLEVNVTLDEKTGGDADCVKVKWEAIYKFTKPESGGAAKMWVTAAGLTI